jgi:membrane associated rhomboid family serine protease
MFMKFPYATIVLILFLVGTYFYLSNFSLYSSESQLLELSFHITKDPILVLVYMFVHTGIYHLFGNLTPLILFAFLLEQKTRSKDTLAIFLLSGVSSAIAFSLFEPKFALLGASAAIAGLMGAATARDPKKAFIALILTPFLIYLVVFPTITFTSDTLRQQLTTAQLKSSDELKTAIMMGQTEKAAQLNATVNSLKREVETITEGEKFERETPTSITIHLLGAIFGIIYLYILNKKEFWEGMNEYSRLTARL